jgi:hypothetical protein
VIPLRRQAIAACVFGLLVAEKVAGQQAQPSSPEQLVSAARAATSRYQDANAAIADGFKRVGVEFPAMGEHWVNLGRVLEDRFDASRPSVLIYITVDGTRRLAGVGYTALLDDGERPPETAAKLSDWHEHNGSVIDESLPVHGASHEISHEMSSPPAELEGLRLAILHVWAWTTNPAGVFVTENWRLPLVRSGVENRELSAAAIRGLSLANDSASYYEQTLRTALQLNDAELARARDVIQGARQAARSAFVRGAVDETALAASWTDFWTALERALPRRRDELHALRTKL